MPDYDTLIYEQDEHVVTLTYNRPDQHNAVSRRMNDELHHAWQRFRDDDERLRARDHRRRRDDLLRRAGTSRTRPSSTEMPATGTQFRTQTSQLARATAATRARADIFKPVIAAVNGYAFAAGLETALLADIRIGAENAEFGALERRWNIVGGDGLTVRLPLVVGYARAMELIITGRRIDVHEAERIGLVNEIVPEGQALTRAQELAREIAALPQGAIRSDKESVMRGIGRTLEERLRIEFEMALSMFMRKDKHTVGASAFKRGEQAGVAEPRAVRGSRTR